MVFRFPHIPSYFSRRDGKGAAKMAAGIVRSPSLTLRPMLEESLGVPTRTKAPGALTVHARSIPLHSALQAYGQETLLGCKLRAMPRGLKISSPLRCPRHPAPPDRLPNLAMRFAVHEKSGFKRQRLDPQKLGSCQN